MYYFKFLAFILGVLMITAGPFIVIFKDRWRSMVLEILLPPDQPLWIWAAAAVSAFIVVITWYIEITTRIYLSWIITLFVSLSVPKLYFLLFRYQETRSRFLPFMESGKLFPWAYGLTTYSLGLFILALGVFAL